MTRSWLGSECGRGSIGCNKPRSERKQTRKRTERALSVPTSFSFGMQKTVIASTGFFLGLFATGWGMASRGGRVDARAVWLRMMNSGLIAITYKTSPFLPPNFFSPHHPTPLTSQPSTLFHPLQTVIDINGPSKRKSQRSARQRTRPRRRWHHSRSWTGTAGPPYQKPRQNHRCQTSWMWYCWKTYNRHHQSFPVCDT